MRHLICRPDTRLPSGRFDFSTVEARLLPDGIGHQWCRSMMRMMSGIGIPTSQSRIGMVSLLAFPRVSD
jgi:hypothetical protein